MDLESLETQTLLKSRTPKRQGLALNWFFTNVYGPLAASQAAGAAPIIQAWLAGEELPATFP